MSLAPHIKHPIKELKGNWVEPKLAGILGDSERAVKSHLDANLGVALGKSVSEQKIGEVVDMLMPVIMDSVAEGVTFSPKHGIKSECAPFSTSYVRRRKNYI
jgi:AraC-like DNA-binding protein